jgi:hypothetical protein
VTREALLAMETRTRSAPKRRQPRAPLTGDVPVAITAEDILFREDTPTILVDGIGGVTVVNGIARLDCFSVQLVAHNAQKPVTVARLVLSLPTLTAIHRGISRLLQQIEKDANANVAKS